MPREDAAGRAVAATSPDLGSATFTKYRHSGAYHWGKLAGTGILTYHARLRARYGFFVREARRRPSAFILDVGCGDGALTHLLSDVADVVVGLEPEPEGVALARQCLAAAGSSADVIIGHGERLPLDDRQVDVVVLCEVIEHLPNPDDVLREIARVLSMNGVVLLSTPLRQSAPVDHSHVREYTGHELGELLGRHFRSVEMLVAEPGWLLGFYRTAVGRAGVNTVARLGLNPFAVTTAVRKRRSRWRQLYARAASPFPVTAR